MGEVIHWAILCLALLMEGHCPECECQQHTQVVEVVKEYGKREGRQRDRGWMVRIRMKGRVSSREDRKDEERKDTKRWRMDEEK